MKHYRWLSRIFFIYYMLVISPLQLREIILKKCCIIFYFYSQIFTAISMFRVHFHDKCINMCIYMYIYNCFDLMGTFQENCTIVLIETYATFCWACNNIRIIARKLYSPLLQLLTVSRNRLLWRKDFQYGSCNDLLKQAFVWLILVDSSKIEFMLGIRLFFLVLKFMFIKLLYYNINLIIMFIRKMAYCEQ